MSVEKIVRGYVAAVMEMIAELTSKAEPWQLHAAKYYVSVNIGEDSCGQFRPVYYSMHNGTRVACMGGFSTCDVVFTDKVSDALRHALETTPGDQHIHLLGEWQFKVLPPED